jgi:Cytidylate kinase-like family
MPDPSLIIAISRQRGSGGAEVGRRLAADLDLRCIDRQLRHAAEFLSRRRRGVRGDRALAFHCSFLTLHFLTVGYSTPSCSR